MRPSLVHHNGLPPSKEGLSRRIWYDQGGSHGKIKSADYCVIPLLFSRDTAKYARRAPFSVCARLKIRPPQPIFLTPYAASGSAIPYRVFVRDRGGAMYENMYENAYLYWLKLAHIDPICALENKP